MTVIQQGVVNEQHVGACARTCQGDWWGCQDRWARGDAAQDPGSSPGCPPSPHTPALSPQTRPPSVQSLSDPSPAPHNKAMLHTAFLEKCQDGMESHHIQRNTPKYPQVSASRTGQAPEQHSLVECEKLAYWYGMISKRQLASPNKVAHASVHAL